MAPPKIIPQHIAIIMDGNGRWARQRGLPRIKGNEKGADAVRECVEGCGELKVEYLTLYAFSAENWQRPKSEVFALKRRRLRSSVAASFRPRKRRASGIPLLIRHSLPHIPALHPPPSRCL